MESLLYAITAGIAATRPSAVANNASAIPGATTASEVFFDNEIIFSLGCEAILNIPVAHKGMVLGTLNILHEAGWYSEDDIPTALVFAGLAVPAFIELSEAV